MSLILASTSPIRAAMLTQAEACFAVRAPDVDEEAIKQSHSGDGESLARALAVAKAESVTVAPSDWVIGSDSEIHVDGVRYSKTRDRAEAAAHLAAFSGKAMILSSAVALARNGKAEWSHAESAWLHVRELSSVFIDSYLNTEWPEVGYCVGVFRMEGRGAQLFDRVAGSHFTVLGLPLLPLLGALRDRNLLPS